VPKSLSHVVVFTDDLDAVVGFLTGIAQVPAVSPYEVAPEDTHALFGWPLDLPPAKGAFVGEGAGSIDVLEIPDALRDTVPTGVRLLAVTNRDAAAAGVVAADAGYDVRGPFRTTAATGQPMSLVEVVAGGVAFELVQFG
jgi:catechol 2,3-dioxygenase-like lactoylglutathione lyase family enzyme